jgi:predicted nucleotidyltransferase
VTGTPTLAAIKRTLRQHLPVLRERYGVDTLALFGSYVRREERSDSDLDLLVTFDETPGLLKFVELENELSDLLGITVDLVVEDSLKPGIGERVRREMEPI